MDRRAFMQMLPAAAVASSAAGLLRPAAAAEPRDPLGAQLLFPKSDPNETWALMERVRAIGYSFVEFAGFNGYDPAEIRRRAESLGLSTPTIHIGADQVRAFKYKGEAEDRSLGGSEESNEVVYTPEGYVRIAKINVPLARDLGCKWVIFAGARVRNFESIDSIKRFCAAFNTSNQIARSAGLGLAYHNHNIDFRRFGDVTALDIMLRQLDPSIKFQNDIGWVVAGGVDPVALTDKYRDRTFSFHLKDARKDGSFSEWGEPTGTIDWPAIRGAGRKLSDPIYVVEGGDFAKAYKFLQAYGWGA